MFELLNNSAIYTEKLGFLEQWFWSQMFRNLVEVIILRDLKYHLDFMLKKFWF